MPRARKYRSAGVPPIATVPVQIRSTNLATARSWFSLGWFLMTLAHALLPPAQYGRRRRLALTRYATNATGRYRTRANAGSGG